MESNQAEQEREKKITKDENRLMELLNDSKSIITFLLWWYQKKREKGVENLFEEIIAENFLNLGKETEIQIQEAQRDTNKINPRSSTPKHIGIKMAKSSDKE